MTKRTLRPFASVYALVETEWFLQLTVQLYAEDDEDKPSNSREINGLSETREMLITVIIPRLQTISGAQIIEETLEIEPLFSSISDAEFVEETEAEPSDAPEAENVAEDPSRANRILTAIGRFIQAGLKAIWRTLRKQVVETAVELATGG